MFNTRQGILTSFNKRIIQITSSGTFVHIINHPQWGTTFPIQQLYTKPVHIVVIVQRRTVIKIVLVFIFFDFHKNGSLIRVFLAVFDIINQVIFGNCDVTTGEDMVRCRRE